VAVHFFPFNKRNEHFVKTMLLCVYRSSDASSVLTDRHLLIAAFANSQQILKKVQDDCKGWCMRAGPAARNGLCGTDHGNEHARCFE
jgi:hypothetical protein